MTDILLFVLPPLLFVSVWLIGRKSENKISLIAAAVITLTLVVLGYVTADTYTEISTIGNILLFSSSMWLIVPILTIKKLKENILKTDNLSMVRLTAVMIIGPILSVSLCMTMLIATGQITGF
ncbi:hypothetical protein [Halocola ammonii]